MKTVSDGQEYETHLLMRRNTSVSGGQGFDPIHLCPKGFTGIFQIIIRLKAKPESFRRTKEPGQPQGRIGGDGPLPLHDLIDPSGRNVNVFRQSVLAQIHGFKKLLKKNFSRMNRRIISHFSSPLLMIIDNFHLIGVCIFPKKTEAVLVIDAEAPLSFSGTLQRLQAISWRNTKIVQRTCPVENPQFSLRLTGQILWNFVGIASLKNFLGLPIPERSDHRTMITHSVTIDKQDQPPLDTGPSPGSSYGAGATNTLRSACPRERSPGPFFFVPPASLISSCRACGEYNTRKGNKPAVSVRFVAPGAISWRPPTKATNLLRRHP